MTIARLQRYTLFLAGFEYSIEYKNTTQHGNADGLSRLPLKKACDKEVVDPATNGMAERSVQTFKQALHAALAEKKSIS